MLISSMIRLRRERRYSRTFSGVCNQSCDNAPRKRCIVIPPYFRLLAASPVGARLTMRSGSLSMKRLMTTVFPVPASPRRKTFCPDFMSSKAFCCSSFNSMAHSFSLMRSVHSLAHVMLHAYYFLSAASYILCGE